MVRLRVLGLPSYAETWGSAVKYPQQSVTLRVWYSDGTEVGGSGHPMTEGWWWEVYVGSHRSAAWSISERAAWHAATKDVFLRCAPEVKAA